MGATLPFMHLSLAGNVEILRLDLPKGECVIIVKVGLVRRQGADLCGNSGVRHGHQQARRSIRHPP